MRAIPHLHDFISELPQQVQAEIERLGTVRKLAKGEAAYHRNDPPDELFRLLEGAVKLCNYTLDGVEIVAGEFRPGDCFGEMGILDGLPRVSHAVASRDSRVLVLSKQTFDSLCERYPEIYKEVARMMGRRVRYLYSLSDDTAGLKLHQRLARTLHRLAYSHGRRNEPGELYIGFSHEELSKMLGATRQSVSKELKALERQGDIELRYGKIFILDLELLSEKYEKAVGMEQIAPAYEEES